MSSALIGEHRAVEPLLRALPERWSRERFKGLFDRLDQRNLDLEYEMLSLRSTGDVVLRSEMGGRQEPDEASLPRYLVAAADDLVVNPMWLIGGGIGVSDRPGAVSPDYRVFRPRDQLLPRFVHYVLRSKPYLDQYLLYTRAQTTFDRRVQQPDLNNLPMPVPPRAEQRAIADYLDRETARIDILIEEQLRLIAMLRERRSAVITQAATRGIDGAPLVNSGNVYLAVVPAHWTVSRFSRELDVNGGQVDPRDDPWADMVLIAPNHIEPGTGRIVGRRETARDQGADSGKYVAKDGQILYSKIRPALNKVALAPEDCLTSADMYAMSSRHDDDHRYLMYFMLARPFHAFATLTALRVKMPKINREELGEAPFVRPPVEEQRRIAAHLDEQTAKIDQLIVETGRFIELSNERRSALITAAVTGQIDVREVA